MSRALVIVASASVLAAVVGTQHAALTGSAPPLLVVFVAGLLGAVSSAVVWSLACRSADSIAAPPAQEPPPPSVLGDRMVAGVAHDFNNLLTIIQLAGQIVELKHSPESGRDILRACAEGQATVEQLVRLSRGQAQSDRATRLDLAALLGELAPLLRAAARGANLLVQVPRHPCWVEADRTMLSRALLNLTVNARDACRGAIIVRLRAHDGSALLSVEDDGDGVPEEVRARLFEPFFTTKESGSGLGLCVVQQAAAALGGTVSVSQADLGGASFTVSLPLRELSLVS